MPNHFDEYNRDGALDAVVYPAAEIAARVGALGREISRSYPPGDKVLLLGLLKGSFVFMGDLVRSIRRPVQVDFLVASSYGSSTTSSGAVKLLYDPKVRFEGRHVILVEDIVDTGRTLNRLCDLLAGRNPLSLEVCALLHKGIAEDLAWEPRWTGFRCPLDFLVGYGLDHAEEFRHLPFIATIKQDK